MLASTDKRSTKISQPLLLKLLYPSNSLRLSSGLIHAFIKATQVLHANPAKFPTTGLHSHGTTQRFSSVTSGQNFHPAYNMGKKSLWTFEEIWEKVF